MKFLDWYKKHQVEATWWVIGWLSFAIIDSILKEDWFFATLNLSLIVLNYSLLKKNS